MHCCGYPGSTTQRTPEMLNKDPTVRQGPQHARLGDKTFQRWRKKSKRQTQTHMGIYSCTCTHTHIPIHTCTPMHTYMHTHAHTCTQCTYMYVHAHIHTRTYAHIHVYTCAHTCTHACMHVHTCTHRCTHMHTCLYTQKNKLRVVVRTIVYLPTLLTFRRWAVVKSWRNQGSGLLFFLVTQLLWKLL